MSLWRIASIGMFFFLGGCASASELETYYKPITQNNYRKAAEAIMREKKLVAANVKPGRHIMGGDYDNMPAVATGPAGEQSPAPPRPQPLTRQTAAGQLIQEGPDKPVQFVGGDCVAGSSCGCSTRIELQFGKSADGSIVILFPVPEINEHIVRRIGPCTYGCGMPAPDFPVTLELPVNNIDRVSSIPVPFETHVVYERCLISMPAP